LGFKSALWPPLTDLIDVSRSIVVLGAVLLILSGSGCKEPGKKVIAVPPPLVTSNTVTFPAGSLQLSTITSEAAVQRPETVIKLTGRLTWNDEVTVRVFSPVGGRVIESSVAPGQDIATGTVLARLASPDYGQAQADVRKANADLLLARKNLERTRELKAAGAAPGKDVDTAEDLYHSAQAELERASTRLALYGGTNGVVDQLYRLTSPLGGTLVEKNISPGQEVRPDAQLANVPTVFSPLFTISDPSRLWLYLDVAERDIPGIKPGLAVSVTSRAYPGRAYSGVIEWVGDGLDPLTRSVRVRANINNPDRSLKSEMYVDAAVTIPDGRGVGAEIPSKALLFDFSDRQYYVYLERAEGQYVRQQVVVREESGSRVVVESGLKAGDKVVSVGALLLDAIVHQSR